MQLHKLKTAQRRKYMASIDRNWRSWCVISGYAQNLSPDCANEFSAAVMRFGHTEIPDTMPFVNSAFRNDRNTRLEDVSV